MTDLNGSLGSREEAIRGLAEMLQEAVWIQDLASRRIVYVSPAYERIWGRSRQSLLDSQESPMDSVHPGDRERAIRRLARQNDGGPVQDTYRILRPDGSWRWVEVTTSPVQLEHGRLLGIASDITHLRETEAENRRLSNLLRETQTIAKVGGWELDVPGQALYWTDEVFHLHDTSPAEFTPTVANALAFYAPESRAAIAAAVQAAIADGAGFDLELEVITARQRRIWVHCTCRVVREDGRTTRILGAFQDITEKRRLQQEARALEAEVLHAQKLESLGHLAGGVAHDMNNVLAAILGMTSALQFKYQDDPYLAGSLGTILQAGNRGRDLVQGLTNFAHKEMGEPLAVDLNDLVRTQLDLLGHTTLGRLELVTDLEPGLPTIEGEAGALANVLMNLCVNALDAMPGGGTLTFATRSRPGNQVELSLGDTGQGMPPEVLARAMEPFYTTKPLGKGTGLGLSMVYGTMKTHGGTVELRSEPGHGTTVLLRFPAAAPGLAPVPVRTDFEPEPGGPSLRILLVDDDELIRATAPFMLEHLGHRVRVAAGGAEALAALEDGLEVDLVVLDHNMPGLTGAETAGRIRALRPALPIILTTGHTDAAVEACLATTSLLWALPKPYSFQEVQRKVGEIFRPAAGAGRSAPPSAN
jgi:PAS domain S-box-containing protein